MTSSAAALNRNSLLSQNSIAASYFTGPNAREFNEAPILYQDNHRRQRSWWDVSGPPGATIEREGIHITSIGKETRSNYANSGATFFSKGG